MSRFWKRWRSDQLEHDLRAGRPTPPSDLVTRLAEEIRGEGHRPVLGPIRIAVATALTGLMLASLTSLGGLGYVAEGARAAAQTARNIVDPPSSSKARTAEQTPGQDQYKPGKGCGDSNHLHKPKPGTGSAKKPCPTNKSLGDTVQAE